MLFPEEGELSGKLAELARDEEWHFHLMGSAADYLRSKDLQPEPALMLDNQIIERVESPFIKSLGKLSERTLTIEDVTECIATSEYSEWNDIFLYVINTLKNHSRAFQFGAAMMQNHIARVETLLEGAPEEQELLQKVRKLPRVWKQHVLIVEDDVPVRELLRSFFERRAIVDTAENGALGLEKVHGRFFDAIICDMPIMNGMDFFRHATAQDPNLCHRFVFCSGCVSPDLLHFLLDHNQPFMAKPFSLSELEAVVAKIMKSAARETEFLGVKN